MIISEPSNPWVSGVAGLFSDEFYRLARRHLGERGLLVQWLQLYEIDFNLVATVLKALSPHFDDYAIYAANYGDMLIVASKEGPVPPIDAALFREPRFAGELARVGINHVQDVEVRHIASKALLAPVLARMPIAANSDYYPVLDQNAARSRFMGHNARDFLFIASAPVPALEMLRVRRPGAGTSPITADEHYPVSDSYHAAAVLRDAIADNRTQELRGIARIASRPEAGLARRVVADCAEPALAGNKIDALFNVGAGVVPFLRPEELAPIWAWVETQPCGSQLSDAEREWLALFKSVGSRDAWEMARRAEELLDRGATAPGRVSYLVMVAMLGHIAQGDKVAAARIWSRYRGKIVADQRSGILLRILQAHAAAP